MMFGGKIRSSLLASRHICWAGLSPLACRLQVRRNFKVALVGAAGGIGQPLSLLLMNNSLITELMLYDVVNVQGVSTDLSHVATAIDVKGMQGPEQLEKAVRGSDLVIITAGMARGPGMTREQLFEINANVVIQTVNAIAKNSAHALIAVVTNPINTLVPLAAEVLKRNEVYDPNRLFGVTTLDCVRAERFIGNFLNINPQKVKVPVIGGHSGITILPILSQCKPAINADEECIAALVHRIQMAGDEIVLAKKGKGSATLSIAYATHRFADALLKGLKGEKAPIESAYVQSDLTEACFFATPLSFGPKGIEKNHGLPELNDVEKLALKSAINDLKKSIEKGINFE
ncbi:malate dehydrogenase-like [Drosophila montana]|uniref:malate dehydrogenase-like n=1 Tax=Drosophila montana TaxID=40370 RepID=UPI00313C2D79